MTKCMHDQRVRVFLGFFAFGWTVSTYKEVKYAETKELKYKAHMTIIIEPAEHFATQAEKKSNKTVPFLKKS